MARVAGHAVRYIVMSMKVGYAAALLGLLVGLGAGHWIYGQAAHEAARLQATSAKDLPASSVLVINPARRSPGQEAKTPLKTGLWAEFDRATNLRSLYEQLVSSATSNAEANYVLARILATCASREPATSPMRRDRRKVFAESIPDTSPDKHKRLALFDELSMRCDGFDDVLASDEEIRTLLAKAAQAGDPKAKAHIVALEIIGSATGPEGPAISDSQLQVLREAVSSRDPVAIVIAGTALSNAFRDLVLETGQERTEIDGRAAREAWRLLGCEYGLDCGSRNRELQMLCVGAGLCGATTLADAVFFYEMSPHQSQLVSTYRQIFRRAVDRNDWSDLHFSRRPNPNGGRTLFAPPR